MTTIYSSATTAPCPDCTVQSKGNGAFTTTLCSRHSTWFFPDMDPFSHVEVQKNLLPPEGV